MAQPSHLLLLAGGLKSIVVNIERIVRNVANFNTFSSTFKTTKVVLLCLTLVFSTLIFFHVQQVQAQANYMINYQGKLTDNLGATVADATYDMYFRLYTAPTGGSPIWTEYASTTVTRGLFSHMLGTSTSLSSVDFNQTLYLGVTIDTDTEMTPRKILGAVPAAFEAENAQTLDNLATTSFLRADQADEATGLLTMSGGASSSELVVSGMTTTTDLYATNDITVSGSASTSNLTVSNSVTLSNYTSGILTTNNTGTLSASTSIQDAFISDTLTIGSGSTFANDIITTDSVLSTGQTDGYCLAYSSGDNWQWFDCQSGTSLFTNSGTLTYLTEQTDSLAIGTTTNPTSARLSIQGTSTNDILNLFSNTGSELLSVTGAGNVGIGSTTPYSRLTVVGLAGQTAPLFTVATSSTAFPNSYFQVSASGITSATGRASDPVFVAEERGDTPGTTLNDAVGVFVKGDYAYVVNWTGTGLIVLDVSDPTDPVVVGELVDATYLDGARDVFVSGNYAYIVTGVRKSLAVVDVSNPTNPRFVGETQGPTPGTSIDGARSVFVSGKYAYVTNTTRASLAVIDISNPLNPVFIAEERGTTPGTTLDGAYDVMVSGNYAYVVNQIRDSLAVIDISNPSDPVFIAEERGTTPGTTLDAASGIYVKGNYAYVANQLRASLAVIDISDPADPVFIAEERGTTPGTTLSGAISIAVANQYAYVANATRDSMVVIDVNDPADPVFVTEKRGPVPGTTLDGAISIFTSGRYIYIANNVRDSLAVFDIGGLETPSALVGNLKVDMLQVQNLAQFEQGVNIGGGLNVGQNAHVSGALTITGTASSSLQANNTNPALVVLSGNVGIGTTTPTRPLTVSGYTSLNGLAEVAQFYASSSGEYPTLTLESGNSAGGNLRLVSTVGEYQMYVSGDDLYFYDGTSDNMRLTDTGELIIGDVSNVTGSYLSINTAGNEWGLYHSDTSTGGTATIGTWVGTTSSLYGGYLGTYTDVPLAFFTNNSNAQMVLTQAGNIGIGTTSPAYKLDIYGDARIDGNLYDTTGSAGTAGYVLQSTADGITWVATSSLGISGGSSISFGTDNQIPFTNSSVDDYDYSSNFTFDGSTLSVQTTGTADILNLFETGGTEVFTVLENGNVGIGTTTPSHKLDVAGNIGLDGSLYQTKQGDTDTSLDLSVSNQVSVYAGGTQVASFSSSGIAHYVQHSINNTNSRLVFATGAGLTKGQISVTDGSDLEIKGFNHGNDIDFIIEDGGGTPITALTIDGTAGNVGIGTTSPAYKLDVYGDARIDGDTIFAGNLYPGADNTYSLGSSTNRWRDIYVASSSLYIGDDAVNQVQLSYNAGQQTLSINGGAFSAATSTFASVTINGNTNLNGQLFDADASAGTPGWVLQTTATGTRWVATSSLNISSGSSISFGTDSQIPFMNSGDTDFQYTSNFSFNEGTDTLTIGGLTLAAALITHNTAATTTVVANNPYAWTIATSTSATPLLRVDTTAGAERVVIGSGSGGGGDVIIGAVGGSTNLVFEEDSVIHGQGGNLLTFGQSGDLINFAVNVGIGSSSPSQALTVDGAIYISSTTPANTNFALYNEGGTLFFNGSEIGAGAPGVWTQVVNDIYYNTGNVAIGTTTSSYPLSIFQTAAEAQVRIAYDNTRFAHFQVDSVGDLLMNTYGNDIIIESDNLWICESGSCPSITASSTEGYAIVENGIYFGNGFKIDQITGTTTQLGVYNASGSVIMIFEQ